MTTKAKNAVDIETSSPSKIGQKVMYRNIIDPSDAHQVFTIVEIETATNWCRMQADVNMNLKPSYVANLTDLKTVEPK